MQNWKTTVAGLAAFGLIAGNAATAGAAACGDLNGNGSFTSADCVRLLDFVAGPPDPAMCGGAGASNCGDLNADGSVNVADVVVCVNVTAGNIPLYAPCSGPPVQGRCAANGGSGTVTVNANVTSNQLWEGPCEYLLDGTIFVTGGNTLKINAGVKVRGKKVSTDGSPSGLIFLRDAKIDAQGTAASPIIFTSELNSGRGKGDWGGIVFNGRAPVNTPGGEALAEGLNNVSFGGNNAADNSGVFRYARVEYAGRALTIDNELNIITMNSVGNASQFDHLQAHYGLDDCHEWFGGTINEKYLVADACGDDGLDWQLGTTSKVQYVLTAQNACSVEAGGSNGFEGDNNENGFENLPRSNPSFCNVTVIGTKSQNLSLNSVACTQLTNGFGWLARRGTAGRVTNTIIEKMTGAGLRMNDASTGNVACNAGPVLSGQTNMTNDIFFDNGPTGDVHASTNALAGANCTGVQFYNLSGGTLSPATTGGANIGTDPGLTTTWPPNPVPTLGSLAATHPAADCHAFDAFFDTTNYIGGFQPGAASWLTSPWVDFNIDGLTGN